MAIDKLREMFSVMVVAKNADAVPRYYHPDFELVTNGATQTYAEFDRGHRTVYATEITYDLEYDEDAWVEATDRVAGRMWITTARPNESPTRIEVLFIATFVDGLIHRLWELTWPDWSQLGAFETYGNR
ncbi:nuclear transport factor 2 family protein [Rhodococcoides yunnanense]|uniref:nuclear transport factor 2 family protein n=1 Tax=Rhodococcoides yunnanense TaxID=278209 RepID=UPI0009354898|nr:nuclear transport factor 2 family protein [Rhodococcus yunnanensis]